MKPIFAWATCLLLVASARAEKAPPLVLENLDGSTFSLVKALKKGPMVFDFWATWCKPCIKSLPKLQSLAEKYANRGVQVLTINIDGPRNLPKVRPFMQRHQLKLPVLLDKTNEVLKQFHLAGVPATLIIATDGTVWYKHQGYRPRRRAEAQGQTRRTARPSKGRIDAASPV